MNNEYVPLNVKVGRMSWGKQITKMTTGGGLTKRGDGGDWDRAIEG